MTTYTGSTPFRLDCGYCEATNFVDEQERQDHEFDCQGRRTWEADMLMDELIAREEGRFS